MFLDPYSNFLVYKKKTELINPTLIYFKSVLFERIKTTTEKKSLVVDVEKPKHNLSL